MSDFGPANDLIPNEIRPLQWAETGKAVTKNGHVMGLDPHLRTSLLQYCHDMGITQIMQELTMGSRGYHDQDDWAVDIDIRLQHEYDWFIQRVDGSLWQSDMHWMSPSDAISVQHFLEAFSAAGFDDVLKSIGEHFGYKGLVAYHLSVIAVSHCTTGSLHVDVTGSGDRSMNVIIPLILADETGPELQVRGDSDADNDEDGNGPIGAMKYQYEVAALVGDNCYHATNAVDYHGEMRMAATIFLADVGEDNIGAILSDYVTYAKQYPPPGQPELLLSQARAHWDRDNPRSKLPTGRQKASS